mmetsp:Transcript_10473/g.18996  ORF Transcript_10473/g.18996 Transcript_10473/m.18996 type:complete len:369 (-) Transcript_10473:64-1170(-)
MAVEPKESELNVSLQEENAQLRKQLAGARIELRLLQNEKRETMELAAPPPKQQKSKYREWISREGGHYEHELIPQEDDDEDEVELRAPASPPTLPLAAGGLHRRHTDSPARSPSREENFQTVHRFPVLLKAKLSDIEAQSPHSFTKSDSSNESFLSHSPFELDNNDVSQPNLDDESFVKSIADRAGWLVGLLILQSCSSFILSNNQGLLQQHIVLVQFLTMLVGAGGNAGNQASVRVIRGLAVGTVRNDNVKAFLCNEFQIGICLSLILGVVGCIRAAIFLVPLAETMAITTSLLMIVMISILIGATLPLLMHYVNIDPAHSSTTIQVLMDILGVTITVVVSSLILNSELGRMMSPDLYADSSDADTL